MDESSSITLLQLIQEVAYCDGSMSQDEEDLIMSLIDSHDLQEDRDALKNRLSAVSYTHLTLPTIRLV